MERQIKDATGIERLGDYFIYWRHEHGIDHCRRAGNRHVTHELLDFYEKFGRQMFEKTALFERLTSLFSSLYEDEPLALKLKEIFRDEGDPSKRADLTTKRLKYLLLVVTRNMTTDSPWPISTNPFAKYNKRERDDCNLHIPLWQLVRASTARAGVFPARGRAPEPKEAGGHPRDSSTAASRTTIRIPAFPHGYAAGIFLNWKTGEAKPAAYLRWHWRGAGATRGDLP
jgi:hypothetical protein